MLKALAALDNGRTLVVLGLSEGNLIKLREKKPILVHLDAMGVGHTIDVLICWGETEQAIAEEIQKGITKSDDQPITPEAAAALEALATGKIPGPTGTFPLGKLRKDDEGALFIKISALSGGKIVLEFGKPTAWIGLDKPTALQMAKTLHSYATAPDVTEA